MKKIPTLFQRSNRLVRDEIVPGAEWVVAGEGIATRKYDGTCCMIRDGKLFKRYDAKQGKTPPAGFEPAQDYDPVTGHMPGWIPVGEGPEDRWHREAFELMYRERYYTKENPMPDGTYELIGPKINGNPEKFNHLFLVLHGMQTLAPFDAANISLGGTFLGGCARTFDGIREFLSQHDIEGIVWYHASGRMVKIKGKDFGLCRPSAANLETHNA